MDLRYLSEKITNSSLKIFDIVYNNIKIIFYFIVKADSVGPGVTFLNKI